MQFDPTTIHNALKKITQHSISLDELSDELKIKCNKQICKKKFPPQTEMEKPKLETEEL